MRSRIAIVLAAAACALLGSVAPTSAMTGGQRLPDPAAAPWMATLAVKSQKPLLDRASCGGVLIGPSSVLTAAHCVSGVEAAATFDVHIAASVFSTRPGTIREISAVIQHPGFELLASPAAPERPEASSARNDIALLLLSEPVRGVDFPEISQQRPEPGAPLDFYGHGLTGVPSPSNPDPRADVLRHGKLAAIDHKRCTAETPAIVDGRSMFCAKDDTGAVTLCPGDSGSPLIRWVAGRPLIAGIFSFAGETAGKQCGQPSFAAFTDPTLLAR